MNDTKLLEMGIEIMNRTETSVMHPTNPRIMHGILGLADESGELVGALKASLYYGKPFDKINLIEELGDTWFYFSLMVDEMAKLLGVPVEGMFEIIIYTNKMKLETRYAEGKYTEEQAKNRDLAKERMVMVNVVEAMINKRKTSNGKKQEETGPNVKKTE